MITRILLFLNIAISLVCEAQNIESIKNRNYMALGAGKGYTHCYSLLSSPNAYNSTKEEYYCKTKDFAFEFLMNPLSGSKETGFKFGYYFGTTLGVSFSKYFIRYSLEHPKEWYDSFNVLMNFNLGIQCAYYFQESNTVIGLRYFNNYNVDELRSGYGNSDDPATLGIFITRNRCDADISYGSDKIPGILTRSAVWDIVRSNFKYALPRKNYESGDLLMYIGFRLEHSILKMTDTFMNLNGADEADTNSGLLTIGIKM